jgi:hypothetical protein
VQEVKVSVIACEPVLHLQPDGTSSGNEKPAMDKKQILVARFNDIGHSLENTGHALALIGLGSVGIELERLDEYSISLPLWRRGTSRGSSGIWIG